MAYVELQDLSIRRKLRRHSALRRQHDFTKWKGAMRKPLSYLTKTKALSLIKLDQLEIQEAALGETDHMERQEAWRQHDPTEKQVVSRQNLCIERQLTLRQNDPTERKMRLKENDPMERQVTSRQNVHAERNATPRQHDHKRRKAVALREYDLTERKVPLKENDPTERQVTSRQNVHAERNVAPRQHDHKERKAVALREYDLTERIVPLQENDPTERQVTSRQYDPMERQEHTGREEVSSATGVSDQSKALLYLAVLCSLLITSCSSLMPPFFPTEAAKRETPPVVIGAIFSCFEFWIVVASPVYGNCVSMDSIGARFMWISGLCTCGLCTVSFGFLYLAPPGIPYIALCMLLRSVQGLATSAYMSSSYAVMGRKFPHHASRVIGSLESLNCLAYMLGPVFGAGLYQIGGFGCPFFVLGGLVLMCSVMTCTVLQPKSADGIGRHGGNIISLARSPLAVVSCMAAMLASSCFGVVYSTLDLHLQQFEVGAVITGLLFLVFFLGYMIATPFMGYICRKLAVAKGPMVVGSVVCAVSLLLYGPCPLLPFMHASVGLVAASLLLLSVGIGLVTVASVQALQTAASNLGFQDNLFEHVAGTFNFAFRLGTFLGPLVSTGALQALGMQWSATISAGYLMLSALIVLTFSVCGKICPTKPAGTSPVPCGNTCCNKPADASSVHSWADSTEIWL